MSRFSLCVFQRFCENINRLLCMLFRIRFNGKSAHSIIIVQTLIREPVQILTAYESLKNFDLKTKNN